MRLVGSDDGEGIRSAAGMKRDRGRVASGCRSAGMLLQIVIVEWV